MAIDQKEFNKKFEKLQNAQKALPVILLLDVSGSMSSGNKIDSLHDAVVTMIDSFVEQELREKIIKVAVITFGEKVEWHTRYTSVNDLKANGIEKFTARGQTPMGTALSMAKEIIEDEDETPKKGGYSPVVVLVSDGQPTDDFDGPLHEFLTTGRTQKCQRFAVAIGSDADTDKLGKFVGVSDNLFFADNAAEMANAFKTISLKTVGAAAKAPADSPRQDPEPKAHKDGAGGFADYDLGDKPEW